MFNSDAADFIGRSYPERPDKRVQHAAELAGDIASYVFGKGATGFCRQTDQPCARNSGKGQRRCNMAAGALACYRERPRMIVVISHARIWRDLFDRLGRACLIITEPGSEKIDVAAIASQVRKAWQPIEDIADYLYNLPLDRLTPWLPMANFQKLSGNKIAEDAQKDLTAFRNTMDDYHRKLYDASYMNPRKKYMKGAYKLDKRVGFQRDLLHDFAQVPASDATHLINAHHFYGAAFPIGHHFDVTAEGGKSLNRVFQDFVTGKASSRTSEKEDITPCDRVLGAL